MAGQISGLGLAYVTVGGIVLWSGVANVSVATVIRSAISGRGIPADIGSAGNPNGNGAVNLGPGSNQAIASEALKYQGFPYDYGGYHALGAWDCSSCVNWVLSRFNITLPGGVRNYDGTYHGPVVAQYQLWSGGQAISRQSVSAGDLVLFGTAHMGIAVNNSEFLSAEDPQNGTRVDPIENFGEGPPNFLRVRTAGTISGPGVKIKAGA